MTQFTEFRSAAGKGKSPRPGIFGRDSDLEVPADLPEVSLPDIVVGADTAQIWRLSLSEAINIALRNGDVVRLLAGDQVIASGVTSFDPAIADANRRAAVAAFDATFNMGYQANRYNQPPATVFGPGIPANTRRDDATLTASLVKPWGNGGSTSVGYNPSTGYLYFPSGATGIYNPRYASSVELLIKQPLLQGAGVAVNRAPIRIAQLQADQSVWEVKEATLALVRSVEEAYWSLQAAHSAWQAIDDVLPLIDGVVHIQEERLREELEIPSEVAKTRAERAGLRQSQIQARSDALQKELNLRNLLGLPPNDGFTIKPTDEPLHAPLQIDPRRAMQLAADNRPSLMLQRLGIRVKEVELDVATNGLRPQLDFQALYRANGLSDNVGDSLDMMFQNQYTDWTLGANFSIPIGRRAARANLQAAELVLHRNRLLLRQELHATAHRLGDLLRQIEATYEQFEQVDIRARETKEWMKGSQARYEDPPPGDDGQDWLLAALNDYLIAIRASADTASERAVLLAQYNSLLATFEEAQGTLLESHQIQFEGDPILQARSQPWMQGNKGMIQPEVWNLASEESAL